jgi:hypothetical protein
MIVRGQRAGRHAGAFGLACGERGNRYLDCSRLQKIRGPCAMGEGRAAHERQLGLAGRAGGAAFGSNPAGEAR